MILFFHVELLLNQGLNLRLQEHISCPEIIS